MNFENRISENHSVRLIDFIVKKLEIIHISESKRGFEF